MIFYGQTTPTIGLGVATHTFPRNFLYRNREKAILLLFSAATHHFLEKTCIATSSIVTFLAISCRDTPFSPKNHVSRTAFLHSDNFSLGDTPFSARFLVSRQTTNKKTPRLECLRVGIDCLCNFRCRAGREPR